MDIAVIGAGPAGIMAALQAARSVRSVTLIEQNPSIGRKLLVTGSGRCNLSNTAIQTNNYTSSDSDWITSFLQACPPEDLLKEINALGIPTFSTNDGWVYPLSQSAGAMVAVLVARLQESGVKLRVATKVEAVRAAKPGEGNGFQLTLTTEDGKREEICQHLVVASGGKAYPQLGSRGNLFQSLQALGHTLLPVHPALGPILVKLGAWQALRGLRFDALASIWMDHEKISESLGNLIFTEKGFNGPAVMNLSHLVPIHPAGSLRLRLDLTAPFQPGFAQAWAACPDSKPALRAFLLGYFPPKAVDFFLTTALGNKNLSLKQPLLQTLQHAEFTINGAGDFNNSQVSTGGVPVIEVSPTDMRSSLVPHLYLVGETLDVIGPCGGYNLHFAFGSGWLAGRALAAERTSSKESE